MQVEHKTSEHDTSNRGILNILKQSHSKCTAHMSNGTKIPKVSAVIGTTLQCASSTVTLHN